MDVGNGTPTTYIECNQFFLAPTDLNGQNPNPALAPHAINNSWGCPPSEGCIDETPTLRQSIENLVAAGVVFVASAGNSGSACSTVSNPPAIYAASFSIAAHSSANVLAGFSSRGPVTFDSSNRRKPDISGPGVSVRSATNSGDTSYSTASGTSMAGPHVVGAIALLLDHDPSLIGQVQQIINRLEQTSNPALTLTSGAPETCGGIHYTTIPNNHFGYGRVDILAAVNQGQGTATPTPPPATPSPTATACGAPAHWMAGEPFPVTMVRGVGVWFPPNGRFYDMGGRQSDAAGSGLLNPYEYDPTTDTWITKTATFEGQQVGNAAAAALNGPSGWRIYMVGGSAGGGTGSTDVVREYDPISDTITLLATDPWPGALGNTTLPGGFAVYNNKLYILGGFQIVPGGMVDAIWEFDPMAAAGSRWTEKTAVLPVPLGYVPATTIGNYIYTAGGSEWDGTTLADSDYSYRYDPVADTITTITSIPRLTAETRALNVDGEMWVMGGGRDAPNPSNEVNIYDPATNSWSLGMPFTTARRNFAVDVDPATGSIFLVGGYAPTASTNSMEIYMPAVPCETPTPTPTNTAEPTATSTPPAEWRLYLPLVVYNWP
jgi:N-acetylneuraminic acid mutarotase